jgi:acyl-CoA synthetase (AMP-forming)/AMP-acid ligase II
VLGVPDPKWGESGVAVVVPASGVMPGEDELMRFLDGRLAKYKWPRRVFFWPSIPKSGYGKVPKHLIREQLYQRGELHQGRGP